MKSIYSPTSVFSRLLLVPSVVILAWSYTIYPSSYCMVSNDQFDLLIYASMGTFIASLVLDQYVKREKINYFFTLLIRAVIMYFAMTQVYYQYFFDSIFDINQLAYQDVIFRDIPSKNLDQLLKNRIQPLYDFTGVLSLVTTFTLLYHRTAFIGLLAFLFTNGIYLMTNVNESCGMELAAYQVIGVAIYLVSKIRPTLNLISGQSLYFENKHPVWPTNHLFHSISILKFIILIGALVMMEQQDKPRHHQYYASNDQSPIKGVWKVKDVEYNKTTETDYQTDTLKLADKIYLSSSRYGKIKFNDTLTSFEYMVNPENNQFELWNFNEFRKIDLKGKFKYLAEDTIRFEGRNEKDNVAFTLVLEPDWEGIK